MIANHFVTIGLPRVATRSKTGEIGQEIGKQDRRRRHGRAAKRLSAHRFARHGRAGGECCQSPQVAVGEGILSCRVRCAALGCERCQR